jgi:hypothetical protein
MLQEKDTTGKPFWMKLEAPARQYYCTLKLVALTLRQRGVEPDILAYIEQEFADIKRHWGPG